MTLPPPQSNAKTAPRASRLRVPQARVLHALLPRSGSKSLPVLTRVQLAKSAGFSPTSGTINRVLRGIPKGSSSGSPHKGLLDLGLLATVDQDGSIAYQITAAGITAIQEQPKLPKMR